MADTRSYPIDFVPGQSSADALNKLPRGNIGAKERSSNESSIDGTAVVISYDIIIPEDGRRQRIYGKVTVRSATAGGVSARFHVDGIQVDRANDATVGAGRDTCFAWSKDVELDAGTYTVDFIVGRSDIGTNIVSAIADGEDGEFGNTLLYVDDVGPAYQTGS